METAAVHTKRNIINYFLNPEPHTMLGGDNFNCIYLINTIAGPDRVGGLSCRLVYDYRNKTIILYRYEG